MSKVRILSAKDIESVFTLPMAISAVEQAYLQKHLGSGSVWPMVFHEFDPGHADLDIKSGNLDAAGVFGLKVVSWYGANGEKGLPALFGTGMIFDIATGQPKAVLNAGPITDLRTGAAAAIGAKYLARKNSENLVMVGCGALAPYLVAATLLTLPGIKSVTLVNPRTPAHAPERLADITAAVDSLLEKGGEKRRAEIKASEDVEGAVRKADVVLTATPSYEPMIKKEWVSPGTHFSCVGSDMSGKQEISSQIFAGARVFGDDLGQCLSVGECEKPCKEGVITGLDAEIGAVIAGSVKGRTADSDVTIFDSTGIALQDVASAKVILDEAERLGLGTVAEL